MDHGKPSSKTEAIRRLTGDAFGLGVALVLLPCVALYLGVANASNETMALPVMAIFGIMILFGSLALVATLFARLQLADKDQALALPEGSIRAAIALSLIVLFAIISIMLYRSMLEPYKVSGLRPDERAALIAKAGDRVVAAHDDACAFGPASQALAASAPAGTRPCAPEDQRYTLHLRPPPAQESTDLAKQLLILVGTLMTSVTSFYFASRGAAAAQPKDDGSAADAAARAAQGAQGAGGAGGAGGAAAATTGSAAATGPAAAAAAAATAAPSSDPEAHADGCNVDITDPTPDEALPAATGGVAP